MFEIYKYIIALTMRIFILQRLFTYSKCKYYKEILQKNTAYIHKKSCNPLRFLLFIYLT